MLEFSRSGGTALQPQRTEPCQRVSGQPWASHWALQAQVHPLQCAEGVTESALGAAAGLGRWFGRVAVLPLSGVFQLMRKRKLATTAHRALPVCEVPALDMPWATARSNAGLQCAAGVVEPELGSAGGLGRWFVGGVVLLHTGVFYMWRHCSATTAHRALPVCD